MLWRNYFSAWIFNAKGFYKGFFAGGERECENYYKDLINFMPNHLFFLFDLGHKKVVNFFLFQCLRFRNTQQIKISKAHDNHRERLLLYYDLLFEILRISDTKN